MSVRSSLSLECAAEAAAGRSFDLDLVGVTDSWCEIVGYRLVKPRGDRVSRLYLSREDALDAWINRCIEWEN